MKYKTLEIINVFGLMFAALGVIFNSAFLVIGGFVCSIVCNLVIVYKSYF